jgi:hypothetical protein
MPILAALLCVPIVAQSLNTPARMSLDQVRAEFAAFQRQYPEDKTEFESFAAQMDKLQGHDKRFEAYKGKPELYPVMPLAWVETEYRRFRQTTKDRQLTLADFGWQMDAEEGGLRRLEAYRKSYASGIILYGFMGSEQVPIAQVLIVEKRAGYVSILLRSGRKITHSGRYSILE